MKTVLDNIESYLKNLKSQEGEYTFLENSVKLIESPVENVIETTKIIKDTPITIKKEKQTPIEVDMFIKEPEWKSSDTITDLFDKIHDCTKCPLGFTRNKFVFGTGSPNADIMVIGEAPGADEDMQGEPFVGRAGQLLTKILEAINLKREDVFICNIIKCRPPENRRPLPNEVDECEPYLMKQIELIKPVFILALGLTSIDTLLKTKNKMGEIRGKILDYHGIKMLGTYHPAALLRNPNWKTFVWEDVKLLRRLYDEYLKNKY